MTVTRYGFEDGTAGSNYVIDTNASFSTNNGVMVDTVNPAHGTKSLRYDLAAGYQFDQVNFAAQTDGTFAIDIFPEAAPTSQSDFVYAYNGIASSVSTDRFAVRYLSTKQFRIIDSTGATVLTTVQSGGYALSTHTRVAVRFICNGASASTVELRTYIGADATTATETLSSTTCTLPPAIDNIRFGKQVSGAGGTGYIRLDDFARGTSQTDWPLTPGTALAPPVANAGPDQPGVEPFTTVTLNSSATTGTVTSRAWTIVSNTSTTTPVLSSTTAVAPTFTTPGDFYTGSSITFRLTATNADGSSTDDVLVTILPATRGLIQASGAPKALKRTVV